MSNNGLPSLTALLGLLAVAGYQNRDKLSELLKGSTEAPTGGQPNSGGGLGGLFSGNGTGGLGGLLSGLGGAGAGGLLGGGLTELIDRLKQNGRGDLADSWVGTGANKAVEHADLEKALGPELLDAIAARTGLPRAEISSRLSKVLPEAVDKYTPNGALPS